MGVIDRDFKPNGTGPSWDSPDGRFSNTGLDEPANGYPTRCNRKL